MGVAHGTGLISRRGIRGKAKDLDRRGTAPESSVVCWVWLHKP